MAKIPQPSSPPAPDQVPLAEAIHDLSSSISFWLKDGWNKNGHFDVLKRAKDKQGRWLITYTFDAPPIPLSPNPNATFANPNAPFSGEQGIENPREMRNDQRRAARAAMDDMEKSGNVIFVESEPEKAKQADIRFFQAKFSDPLTYGQTENEVYQRTRQIFISEKFGPEDYKPFKLGSAAVIHETLHGLGEGHPGDFTGGTWPEGCNPKYSAVSTIQAYVFAYTLKRGGLGLGPYDRAWIRHTYGAPQGEKKTSLTLDELTQTASIDAQGPIDLNLKSAHSAAGYLVINAWTPDLLRQINGAVNSQPLFVRLTPGTEIKDVILPLDSHVRLEAAANPGRKNHLQGGAEGDDLFGRASSLTGGGGKNRFIFDIYSGFDNVIEDFKRPDANNQICFDNPPDFWRMNANLHYDERRQGTEMTFLGPQGQAVASVFIKDAKPNELRQHIIYRPPGVGPVVMPSTDLDGPPAPPIGPDTPLGITHVDSPHLPAPARTPIIAGKPQNKNR